MQVRRRWPRRPVSITCTTAPRSVRLLLFLPCDCSISSPSVCWLHTTASFRGLRSWSVELAHDQHLRLLSPSACPAILYPRLSLLRTPHIKLPWLLPDVRCLSI
ncbi:hypothetical protein BDV95DRAFT_90111 [Massariosphaeria phaeospora]|uniref:Uncharacterized protein n=1 Tax=Massariosphaeria phaeospora TaxID=100035 RepID=A0A7C8M9S1_9PLEO|nr:hypothetical protein BDV95DRAFT_90111 [Massariosphaeria phaeospora]